MTIILITLTVGMLLFQALVSWEAYRRLVKHLKQEFNINWFVMPKEERSFQQRTPCVMSLDNDPKALRKAWREILK